MQSNLIPTSQPITGLDLKSSGWTPCCPRLSNINHTTKVIVSPTTYTLLALWRLHPYNACRMHPLPQKREPFWSRVCRRQAQHASISKKTSSRHLDGPYLSCMNWTFSMAIFLSDRHLEVREHSSLSSTKPLHLSQQLSTYLQLSLDGIARWKPSQCIHRPRCGGPILQPRPWSTRPTR